MQTKKNNNYDLSEKLVRKMRQNIFNYPKHLENKADRVLTYLIKRKMRMYVTESNNYHWMYAAEGTY